MGGGRWGGREGRGEGGREGGLEAVIIPLTSKSEARVLEGLWINEMTQRGFRCGRIRMEGEGGEVGREGGRERGRDGGRKGKKGCYYIVYTCKESER